MKTLRTPDERFVGLPDFPFEPHYAEVGDDEGGHLRMHYLDEGPGDAAPVLLVHGEPSWSFLYRHVIPPLVGAGHRVVVPDLVGFGRSDKPTEHSDYTYARHVAWLRQLVVDHLDLTGITFFGQDWGGLLGLCLVASDAGRFAGVVVSNTGLPTGHGPASDAFLEWQRFSQDSPHFPIGRIIAGGCTSELSDEVVAAYDAPFPEDAYTAGARIFPSLVPTSPEDPASDANKAAWRALGDFERPFLVAFSDGDPVTRGGEAVFHAKVPGTRGQAHRTIEGAGHFVQEDRPAEVARAILDVLAAGT
ncbi:MAG: haloalkane dehalogenase [Acidimicrobiales bacterium]|nr:haloalkane dehalogenase [Acidimicrobiales bacterium]